MPIKIDISICMTCRVCKDPETNKTPCESDCPVGALECTIPSFSPWYWISECIDCGAFINVCPVGAISWQTNNF